jgi:glycosyltransferase involved in cell wall biosynthesis
LTTLLSKAREKGIEESWHLAARIGQQRLTRLASRKRRGYLFISPPLSGGGAPYILMQIVEEFASRYGAHSVRLLAPWASPARGNRSTISGVRVERAAEVLGASLVRLQLALRHDDFVLLNTVAVSTNYLDVVLDALRSRKLRHAYWYLHEDVEQLRALAPFLLEPAARSGIGQLAAEGRLTLLVPSAQTKAGYDALFENTTTKILPFKRPADGGSAPRPQDDYGSLRFLISGTPTDGRKGHMLALAAFHEFLNTHYRRAPASYRPFSLTLIGMTDDYIAEQICMIGTNILGDRLDIHPPVPHDTALEITRACNVVICSSLVETGPLYVLEAMRAGQVVLRNEVGMREQLVEGVNGLGIDTQDVRQFAGVLERVLNKTTTSDAQLAAMGAASQEIARCLGISSYVDALDDVPRGADFRHAAVVFQDHTSLG